MTDYFDWVNADDLCHSINLRLESMDLGSLRMSSGEVYEESADIIGLFLDFSGVSSDLYNQSLGDLIRGDPELATLVLWADGQTLQDGDVPLPWCMSRFARNLSAGVAAGEPEVSEPVVRRRRVILDRGTT